MGKCSGGWGTGSGGSGGGDITLWESVKENGAIGDGVTDDTAAIQATIDLISTPGGVCYFPPGIYRITAPIIWPDADGITLQGAGKGASKIEADFGGSPSTTDWAIEVNPSVAIKGVTVRDISLEGSANNDTAIYDLLYFGNASDVNDVVIENVGFRFCRHDAIRFSGTAGNRAVIHNCSFSEINNPATMTALNGGVIFGAIDSTIITECDFRDCSAGTGHHAVYIESASKLVIADNTIDGEAYCNVHLFGGTINELTMTGNAISGTGASSKQVLQNIAQGIISGNSFVNTVPEFAASFCEFSSNTVEWLSQTYGLRGAPGGGLSRLAIIGNRFSYTGAGTPSGVLQFTSTEEKWVIADNIFDAVPIMVTINGIDMIIKNNVSVNNSYNGDIISITANATRAIVIGNYINNGSFNNRFVALNGTKTNHFVRGNEANQGKYEFGAKGQFGNCFEFSPKSFTIGKTYTAFTAAATSESIRLFELPAEGLIHGFVVKHSTAFAAAGLTAATIEIGVAGTTNKYTLAFDVFQAVGSNVFQVTQILGMEDFAAGTDILVTLKTTGANINTLTAGSFNVYPIVSTIDDAIFTAGT